MAKQPFQEIIKGALDADPTDDERKYDANYESLKQLAASIQQWFGKQPVSVLVEPGYQIDVGQQFNVVLQIPEKAIRDTLFRAYLAPDGTVRFDFYGEDYVTCSNADEMGKRVQEFLSQPEVRSRMRVYKDLAS